jgi:integrase
MALQRLSGGALNALYGELLKSGRADGSGGLSPATVRRVHATLHHALKDAVRWQHLMQNPADAADPPRVRRSEMKVWTPSELRGFLKSIHGHRLYAAFALAALTGMRRGEVLGLRWGDVDLDGARVAVRRTLVTVGYRVEMSEPKTAQGRRSIDLDPTTVTVLKGHRAQQAEERLAWGPQWADGGWVFTQESREPVHPDTFSKTFDRLVKRAGLPRIRLHDLRHTNVAHSLAAGVPVKVISERVGHSTTAFTQDVYGHVIPGMGKEAAAKVAALVFGP